jgi:hypothetical protein
MIPFQVFLLRKFTTGKEVLTIKLMKIKSLSCENINSFQIYSLTELPNLSNFNHLNFMKKIFSVFLRP